MKEREERKRRGDTRGSQEERREEQWESVRRRELVAGDQKRAAELAEELAAKLEAGADDGENKEGRIELRNNLEVEQAGSCEDDGNGKREAIERCLDEERDEEEPEIRAEMREQRGSEGFEEEGPEEQGRGRRESRKRSGREEEVVGLSPQNGRETARVVPIGGRTGRGETAGSRETGKIRTEAFGQEGVVRR